MDEVRRVWPGRVSRLRQACTAGPVVVALLGVSGCSGDSGAPVTVGPTASLEESATYEPTLPPYTSEVELSAEDEADVEELLLLVDGFVSYSSGISEANLAGLERLSPYLSDDLVEAYRDTFNEAHEKGMVSTGTLSITDASVWSYEAEEAAQFAMCFEYDNWGLVESSTGLTEQGESVDGVRYQMGVIQADASAGKWVLHTLRFGDEKNECSELR